ncbi:MAG: FAD-dependent oxidoreductase [Clostridium perfringens]|uniref:Nitrate reductase, NADH oxidase subunit n=1 Tax=Clostridium perfringens D str. JGS1721 TaxID=488537 RepID=B1V3P3_CLOPF|nr:FAD-dependent oxidoreductase [Clostridium perfringens]STB15905.1 nitrate reductase, NADH oxidase subunit [Clostridium novyi]EDT71525.1 nitrate reductase, NADH oxidase subunit [Clostridium perfringens D str. JGS1721]EHK2334034.1 NAD(P)/FAD-dependent oxidoreductase [Clostridium perfringens]ELC8464493.1 NAD(P)/FAD-dependent oxidoreductase [Clostridium perfringens]MBI6004534.1 NAD(P)/FAD-dependent oxidoreductase [Clostridium perfringens]
MRYIVVGASAAGISGAKTLRELDKDAEIILVSKDENVYSRCILHHYISGHRDIEALDFTDRDFFEKYNIEWKKGLEVKSIDDREHVIGLSNGESLKYDKILLATGASAFIPPVENLREAKNVVGLRNLEDAIKIKEEAEKVKNVVVLGAGLVGIDAIAGLAFKDLNVTLVEMGDRVLPIQLDKYASSKYEKRFEDAGVKLKLGVRAEKVLIDENKNPKALLINTGEEIPCELIIVATGVRSNVAFLKDSSIETDRFGLIINEKGETNARDVYGAGDITGRNPIWPTAVKEGIIAANNMVGNEIFMEDFFGSKNTMNFLGLTTMSLGVVNAPDDSYTEEIDISGENYKKIIHKDGKIYGAIIQGDLSYAGVLTQLIKEKIHVSKVKKPLFEIDYADFFNIKENLEYTY